MLADPKTGLPQLPSSQFLEAARVALEAASVEEVKATIDDLITEDLEGKRFDLEYVNERLEYEEER